MYLKEKSDFCKTFSGSEEGIKKVPMNLNHLKEKKIKELVTNSSSFKMIVSVCSSKGIADQIFHIFFIVTCECICDFFLLRQKFT